MPVNEKDTLMAGEIFVRLKPYISVSIPRTQDTFNTILDLIYGSINGKEEQQQLAILQALIEIFKTKFDHYSYVKQGALYAASSYIPAGSAKDFFNNLYPKSNNGDSEQRAKGLLGIVLLNSPLAKTDTTARNSRSDSNATIWDEDEFDFSEFKSQEHKNRELVGDLYRKSLNELLEYCAFLQKEVKQLEVADKEIIKNIKNINWKVYW